MYNKLAIFFLCFTSYIKRFDVRFVFYTNKNAFEKTEKFLKENKDIIVTKADKGNKTVIIYRKTYQKSMQKLLNDKKHTIYVLDTDPTQKLQRANNKIVTDLYKQNLITKYEKIKLTSNSATAPSLYGLPKIYKEDMPLRPISSSVEVPCCELSKYVGIILKNLVEEKYNTRNSKSLKTYLNDILVEEEEILVSLDVVSLFTNIPIHLAINNIMQQWDILQKHTKIPKKQFLKILQFCLNDNNNFFI